MLKTPKTDSELWDAVRNDDESAFDTLFKRYWARLYKIAFQQLNDQESSLEIVHDVFLSLWNRRATLEIKTFPNFLLTAIRYQIYSRQKSARMSVAYRAEFDEAEHLSEPNSGDVHIRELELQLELNQYLDQLPRRCHEIFRLSRIENLSNQEIADKLGVSKKSVENQLTIALKYLRVAYKNIAYLLPAIIHFIH
jgi:RNA polymerase sigma-70 factor (ECF subfamily)